MTILYVIKSNQIDVIVETLANLNRTMVSNISSYDNHIEILQNIKTTDKESHRPFVDICPLPKKLSK